VATLGEIRYPDAYGGLTVRLTGSGAVTMTVYVVAARAEPFLAAIREQASRSPATEYSVVHVPHTWADLNALALKIEGTKDQWRARGIYLSASADAPTSKVIIALRPYRPAAAAALTAAYGDDWTSVIPSSARYKPLAIEATINL
jgi:hypothetical protein